MEYPLQTNHRVDSINKYLIIKEKQVFNIYLFIKGVYEI